MKQSLNLGRAADRPAAWALLAALIGGAGLLLRLWRMTQITLWADEYITIRSISYPPADVLFGRYPGDLNPPLYYVLLQLYTRLFSDAELVLRSFSLIWGMLALPLTMLAAYELTRSRWASLGALAIAAFHPMFINYSVEVRVYAMLTFWALLAVYAYLRTSRGGRSAALWAGLAGLAASAAAYTHHFGALTFVVLAAFAAVDALSKQWRRAVLLIAALALGALAYVPGLLILRAQIAIYPPLPADRTPLGTALQLFTFSYHNFSYEPLVSLLAGAALIAGLAVLAAHPERRSASLALCLGLGASLALLAFAFMIGINLVSRYLVHLAALAPLGIVATLLPGPGALRRAARLLGLVCVGVYMAYGLDFTRHTADEPRVARYRIDWRPVAGVIAREQRADEQLVILGWDALPVQYYLRQIAITSFQLEHELRTGPRPSYLIVDSYYGRKVEVLERAAPLYESRAEGVRLLRISPCAGADCRPAREPDELGPTRRQAQGGETGAGGEPAAVARG